MTPQWDPFSLSWLSRALRRLPGPSRQLTSSPRQALPTSTRGLPNSSCPATTQAQKRTASTFADKTTDFSASTEDCLRIADSLSAPEWAGSFLLRPADCVAFGCTAVTCRSCSFVVETKGEGGTSVDSEDVVGYMRDAEERFGGAGAARIGADGETVCEDGVEIGAFVNVKWTIAHVLN
ncbi:hypothetical protein VUR80DRAFT_9666 [Thermomyces stellatus]